MNDKETKPLMTGRPVVFGEVLFDVFSDNTAVLGGAPFNVAWHLQGFGLQPLLISRIGDDERGGKVLQTMHNWGMDTAGIQIDDSHPTGTVQITLDQGQPSFTITPLQAYDFISEGLASQAIAGEEVALLYHGSLISRNAESHAALQAVSWETEAPLFVDINLRPPWWQETLIDESLRGATWIKLNDKELAEITRTELTTKKQILEVARRFIAEYRVDLLIITLGAQGALIIDGDNVLIAKPVKVNKLVDTVGAGDAFSSVVILGLMHGWTLKDILNRALAFASAVCGNHGAVIGERKIYDSFLTHWA